MLVVMVLVAIVVLIALVLVALYNRLVRLRNRTQNAWAQVDVQLQRRHDLIPNLVETVKGYAAHERAVFDEVTEARSRAQGAKSVAEAAAPGDAAVTAILRPGRPSGTLTVWTKRWSTAKRCSQ